MKKFNKNSIVVVNCVSAKRFNSIFKQFVYYRKTGDLIKYAINKYIFYEDGIGLRYEEAMFYPLEACMLMLSMRLRKDYPLCSQNFIKINCKFMIMALSPYVTTINISGDKMEKYLRAIQKLDIILWLKLMKKEWQTYKK